MSSQVFSHLQESTAPSHTMVTWENKHHHSKCPPFLPSSFHFVYWAWCHMVGNIPLFSLGHLCHCELNLPCWNHHTPQTLCSIKWRQERYFNEKVPFSQLWLNLCNPKGALNIPRTPTLVQWAGEITCQQADSERCIYSPEKWKFLQARTVVGFLKADLMSRKSHRKAKNKGREKLS